MNRLIGGIIGGAIGGAIGAAIWCGIAYGTGYEIGYVAWGVGLLVGLGVAMGAQEGNPLFGVIAVVIAISAVLAGKYLTIELIVNKHMGEAESAINELADELASEDAAMITIATDIADAWESQGVQLDWPEGSNNETAVDEQDFPVEVWTAAVEQWNGFSEEERRAYNDSLVQELRGGVEAFRSDAIEEGFTNSFDWRDIIFSLLAIATAYQVAASAGGDD